jgi:hypothetical protein
MMENDDGGEKDIHEKCSQHATTRKELAKALSCVDAMEARQKETNAKLDKIYDALNGFLDERGALTKLDMLETRFTIFDLRLSQLEENHNDALGRMEMMVSQLLKRG